MLKRLKSRYACYNAGKKYHFIHKASICTLEKWQKSCLHAYIDKYDFRVYIYMYIYMYTFLLLMCSKLFLIAKIEKKEQHHMKFKYIYITYNAHIDIYILLSLL